MLNSIRYSLPETLDKAVWLELVNWSANTSRLWAKDATLWTSDDEAKWLGWLDIVEAELGDLQQITPLLDRRGAASAAGWWKPVAENSTTPSADHPADEASAPLLKPGGELNPASPPIREGSFSYHDLQEDIRDAGFTDILLMGMGGSSLCPEVLAITFGKQNFHILDSTVPAEVKAVQDKLDLEKTLFIVASKSGSTLEPNCFKQYFFDRVSQISVNPGRQFVAITDPGSKMEQIAKADRFRHIFYGKAEIGGRFSALSAFGLVAAAAMGLDVERFLQRAREMVEACRKPHVVRANEKDESYVNPGALLGTILGVCHREGRDKLTIFTSPEIYDLGAWLEQLIAESTGKNGVAIIPIDREPPQPPVSYANDRLFVYLSLKGSKAPDEVKTIAHAGLPFIEIEIDDIYNLGQEFFRWEFATAVAGSIMKINPFNQPDVESAKIEARKITDEYERTGKLPEEKPFFEQEGVQLFSSTEYARKLEGMIDEQNLANYLSAHLANIEEDDYFALLAYVEMNQENKALLQQIRTRVLEQHLPATCLGFGPRFLHSTGQAYKGGANNGVFLQITSDDEFDLPVPGQKYTFGVVKAAQARGDFQVLLNRKRRALRVHLSKNVPSGLKNLAALMN